MIIVNMVTVTILVTKLAKRENEKHITFCIDGKQRESFQALCKTFDMSVANVMRKWVETALEEGSIDIARSKGKGTNNSTTFSSTDKNVINNMLKRIDEIEKNTAYLNENQMEFIKDEVLGDSFGTLRFRLGIVEKEIQDIGGNISR